MQEGWNLIGGVGSQLLTGIAEGVDDGDIDDPDGIIVDGTLYGWNNAYSQSYEMSPGKGYWLRAFESGTVTINPPTNV